jgi:segregation and condensation protein B
MSENYIRNVVEAALLAAGRPLQLSELSQLFEESARPEPADLRAALDALQADYGSRGIEVKETATGFRIQVKRELANEVSRLWPERPPRYSRALLETLALIAYRQPITRAEIEAVRGVAVNPNIIKTVLERGWVRVVGTRDVPGRPELLGTTKEFLDYFGLRSLEDLPPLSELKAMGEINLQLDLAKPGDSGPEGGSPEGSGGAGGAAPADANGSGDAGGAVAAASAVAAVAGAVMLAEGASGSLSVSVEDAAGESDGDAAPAASETSAEAPVEQVPEVEPAPMIAATEDVDATEATPATASDDEADSGDVTVEVETLGLVEARIEAFIEPDEVAPREDAAIETGQFELAELGMSPPPPASVLEAEFDSDDLENAAPDEESSDDEEELSAGPQSSTELVASPPRDNND